MREWANLQDFMEPLARASVALPPAAFRQDPGAILTAGKFLPSALGSLSPEAAKLTGPFSELVEGVVSDDFIVNWLDLLCYLLSGLDAKGEPAENAVPGKTRKTSLTVGNLSLFLFLHTHKKFKAPLLQRLPLCSTNGTSPTASLTSRSEGARAWSTPSLAVW